MNCVAWCFYIALAASTSSRDVSPVGGIDMEGQPLLDKPGWLLGNAAAGFEHRSGVFFEVDHTSGLTNGKDRGWAEYRIGIRRSWALGQ